MPRDKDEALKRLQAQLLEEEEDLEENEEQEEFDDEEPNPEEDDSAADMPVRNYASGYKIYNSDRTDTDLDRFSDAVRQPGGSGSITKWILLPLVLMLIFVCLVLCYLVKGGHL